MSENIKKKEDLVSLAQWILDDQLKNLKEENWKTNILFVVIGIFATLGGSDVLSFNCANIVPIALITISFILGIISFYSRTISYYPNLKSWLNEGKYDEYLDIKHEEIMLSFNEVDMVLKRKINLNNASFAILGFSAILLLIINLIY